jgi:tetratricopeptide (TPR) repeat protein
MQRFVRPYFYALDIPTPAPESDAKASEVKPKRPARLLENPPGIDPAPIPLTNQTEVDLVEALIRQRALYARCLNMLALEMGSQWTPHAQRELMNFVYFVKPYWYLEDLIVPVVPMTPAESIAEADRLYQEGRSWMVEGGSKTPALYNPKMMKIALVKFKRLVFEYPTSDKIDDAAFQIGDIHKEYFQETDNSIALLWYEKASEWDPMTPHPARFQIAAVYDYRRHEREEALYWYQQVLDNERHYNKSNVNWAQNRIRQLTAEKHRDAPMEPIPAGPARTTETRVEVYRDADVYEAESASPPADADTPDEAPTQGSEEFDVVEEGGGFPLGGEEP